MIVDVGSQMLKKLGYKVLMKIGDVVSYGE